jgi:hypothetical protein
MPTPAPRLVGSKLIPADTFDPNEIDEDPGWAEGGAQSISIRRSAIFRAALRGRLISVLV